MALKPVLLSLLWGLTLFVHGVMSFCNVTCSTNYKTSLNCTCTDAVPTFSLHVKVECREPYIWSEVKDTCEINPPQSWCIMDPDGFIDVVSVLTECNTTVSQKDDPVTMNVVESSTWLLHKVVKPLPPFDVHVTNEEKFYNFSWDHDNNDDCLQYTVRIRESNDLSKGPVYSLLVDEKHIELDHKKLQSHVSYTVDVKAKLCPEPEMYEGPWSEWSSTTEWTTTGMNRDWWYIMAAIILVVGLLLIGYFKRRYLHKKLQLITYIPKPDEFFKPLYNNYGGNFKDWVKPGFSEYDYSRTEPQVPMKSDVLQWNNEKQSYKQNSETRQGGHFLQVLQPHSNPLLFFPDGGSSQGTSHSTGHISIHTVTLSGEEFEEEAASQSSLRSYQDGESFGSFGEDNQGQAGYGLEEPQMARLDRQSLVLPHHENQISNDLPVDELNFQPHVQLHEPERVSLDSFASHEQSEDGYPHVDLDTIDSGFGECSSPGATDSKIPEQINSDSFNEHKSSNSNYVKQWMVCHIVQEDSGNAENELPETH